MAIRIPLWTMGSPRGVREDRAVFDARIAQTGRTRGKGDLPCVRPLSVALSDQKPVLEESNIPPPFGFRMAAKVWDVSHLFQGESRVLVNRFQLAQMNHHRCSI